ncbi:radical SAM protein [Vibrio owensii]|uniref:radical SAM protein n=1 Tax=Vibrio harveyi group TaxID=717610 RepID=UPI003CC6AF8D
MYIQITTLCQMSCAHCMMNCARNKHGESMSHETYARAIELAVNYDEMIVIGGGEPTIHKNFFDFLDYSLRFQMSGDLQGIFVITNGGFTKKALKLLEYTERYDPEAFGCQLSLDSFHDPIDNQVIDAYKRAGKHFIRSVDEDRLIYMGSARENNLPTNNTSEGCSCEDIFITPEGNLKSCACEDAEILGNILEMSDEQYDEFRDTYSEIRDELEEGDVCHAYLTEDHYERLRTACQPQEVPMAA